MLALHHGRAPGTANLQDPSQGLPASVDLIPHGAQHRLPGGPRMALTNSFGFGGTNACLLFSTPPDG